MNEHRSGTSVGEGAGEGALDVSVCPPPPPPSKLVKACMYVHTHIRTYVLLDLPQRPVSSRFGLARLDG